MIDEPREAPHQDQFPCPGAEQFAGGSRDAAPTALPPGRSCPAHHGQQGVLLAAGATIPVVLIMVTMGAAA